MQPGNSARSRSLARLILALAAITLTLSPAALAGAQTDPEALATLRIATPPIDNLDPVLTSRFDPYMRDLVENLFVGLTRIDPVTQTVEPALAESWAVSEDGLTWTFTLRDDMQWVRYAGGEVVAVRPVQAGDFVYAIQRACDPLRPSPVTANLMIVRGCQTVANAFPEVIDDLFIAREIGVRATGPHTLEIDILFPAAYFPTLVSTPEFRPLPREAVTAAEDWTAPDTIITNGPYVLEARTADGLSLVRNPFWPDDLAGNVGRVTVAFEEGTPSPANVDVARLTAESAEALRAREPGIVFSTADAPLTVLGFSYDREVVQIPEVRRGLALAIDREALVERFFPGQAIAPTGFTPPGVVSAPAFDGFTFNPAAARSAFSAAGFPNCESMPEQVIVLVPAENPVWLEIGAFLVEQWSTNLGCNPALFDVMPLERGLMIELSHGTYDAELVTRSHSWVAQWSADYPDANAWISDALHCRYGWIRTGRPCDRADAALDRAAIEADEAARAEQYAEAEASFFGPNGSFPVIPLFTGRATWLQQPWVSGVNEYGPARFDLWTIDTDAQPAL